MKSDASELTEDSSDEETSPITPLGDDKIDKGDFVLVSYTSKAGKKYYAGVVEEIDEDLTVKFLRRKGQTFTFIFPMVDDRDVINRKNICGKLNVTEKPGTSRTSQLFAFKTNLKHYKASLG